MFLFDNKGMKKEENEIDYLSLSNEDLIKYASHGDTMAMTVLGVNLLNEGDGLRAIPLLKAAGKSGIGEAYYYLGWIHQVGIGLDMDGEKAFKYYTKSVEADCAAAYDGLADCYLYGYGVPIDEEKVIECLHAGEKRGDPTCTLRLGTAYRAGTCVEADLEKAEKYLKEAVELRADGAYEQLCICLEMEDRAEEAWKNALRGLKLGEEGCLEWMVNYAPFAKNNAEERTDETLEFLREAIKKGSILACCLLVEWFDMDIGDINAEEASEALRKANQIDNRNHRVRALWVTFLSNPLFGHQDLDEALRQFHGLDMGGDDYGFAACSLGDALAEAKRYQEAKDIYIQAETHGYPSAKEKRLQLPPE